MQRSHGSHPARATECLGDSLSSLVYSFNWLLTTLTQSSHPESFLTQVCATSACCCNHLKLQISATACVALCSCPIQSVPKQVDVLDDCLLSRRCSAMTPQMADLPTACSVFINATALCTRHGIARKVCKLHSKPRVHYRSGVLWDAGLELCLSTTVISQICKTARPAFLYSAFLSQ